MSWKHDDPGDLNRRRNLRVEGEISREEYWSEVQTCLAGVASLAALLGQSEMALRTAGGEVLLDFSLGNGVQVCMSVDWTDRRSVPVLLVADGAYESLEMHLVIAAASTSEHFLDIGANVGYYSLAVASSHSNLRVSSFEPNPDTFESLRANIERSSLASRVATHNFGLDSISRDDAVLYVPAATGSGGASLVDLHPEEGPARLKNVELRSLDSLSLDPAPDLMKIDVEGAELGVLNGAMKYIERTRPTIFIELLRKWMRPYGTHPQDVLALLLGMGYRAHAIGHDGLREIEEVDETTQEKDFLFIHPSRDNVANVIFAALADYRTHNRLEH